MDLIRCIEQWYASNCDGDWEHSYGVTINTLDNPGWVIQINLAGTSLEGVAFETVRIERSDTDWVTCKLEGESFHGYGGANNLGELLRIFIAWAEARRRGV